MSGASIHTMEWQSRRCAPGMICCARIFSTTSRGPVIWTGSDDRRDSNMGLSRDPNNANLYQFLRDLHLLKETVTSAVSIRATCPLVG